MKNDNAYVVAVSRAIDENDKEPNPWKYLRKDGKRGETDLNEKRATRFDLGEAKEWVSTLNGVDGYRATYFVASEFFK